MSITPPDEPEVGRHRHVSLVVPRHARVALLGDEEADEAWLILHGYGMTSQGILHWFRSAAAPSRLLVAPEGLSRFYQRSGGLRTVGASWMTREDRENEIDDQFEYLESVAARWLAGRKVQVHGFSQGVPAACRWVSRTRREISKLVCWGSPTPGDLATEALREGLGAGSLHLVVGESDRYFNPEVVARDAAKRREEGLEAELIRFEGGHEVPEVELAKFSG